MLGQMAALASAALWAGASILYTQLRETLSAPILNLFKTGAAGILLWGTFVLTTGTVWPHAISSVELGWLAASGILGLAIGDSLLFEAFGRIGPRKSLLISALSPALTALLAWPILGEPLNATMVAGMTLTLGGITWVISGKHPGVEEGSDLKLGYLFALGAALSQAAGCIATKLGGQHNALDLTVVRVCFGVMALILFLAFKREWPKSARKTLDKKTLRTLFIAMFIGTYLGIWLQVTGLRYAPAGIAATLSATSPIFVLPLAAMFLNDPVKSRSIIGALIAVAGIAVLLSPI